MKKYLSVSVVLCDVSSSVCSPFIASLFSKFWVESWNEAKSQGVDAADTELKLWTKLQLRRRRLGPDVDSSLLSLLRLEPDINPLVLSMRSLCSLVSGTLKWAVCTRQYAKNWWICRLPSCYSALGLEMYFKPVWKKLLKESSSVKWWETSFNHLYVLALSTKQCKRKKKANIW